MFRRKDEKEDQIHHTNIKRGITGNFSKTLKILQQRHLQTEASEFIYSNDASNNLCNVLEAVFLHGLKDSVAQKLTSYVGLSLSTIDNASGINFWSVAAKFTHNDVLVQLQSMSQLATPIGWCRAWVRMALNDGLMQSYLHSMIVDVKTLKYFYHSFAYLRDFEQPGILKNLLAGLMSLEFKLSCNSSVLNTWNKSTLQLVGLLDGHHVPSPTIALSSSDASVNRLTSSNPLQLSSQPIFSQPGLSDDMISISHDTSVLGPSQTFGSQHLTGTLLPPSFTGDSYLSMSEGSTCSHISCPDPAPPAVRPNSSCVRGANTDQSFWPGDNKTLNNLEGKADVLHENTATKAAGSITSITFDKDEISLAATRPRSRQVDSDDIKYLSPKAMNYLSMPSSIMSLQQSSPSSLPIAQSLENLSTGHSARPENKHQPSIKEHVPSHTEKLNPDQQEAILQEKVAQAESDMIQCQKDEHGSVVHWVSDNITLELKSDQGKSLEPLETPATNQQQLSEDEIKSGGESQELKADEIYMAEELSTSGRFGNSLTGMSGWSSEIQPKKNLEFSQHNDSSKFRGESFASMLRRYTPEQQNRMVTLDQVIETLSPADDQWKTHIENHSNHSDSSHLECQDPCLDDFEVLMSPSHPVSDDAIQANSSRMLFLFQVAREQGLSHQNYTCRGCHVGLIFGPHYLCEFDGGLYCCECHDNSETYIPSAIIFNWDFRKKKVCKENFQFLQDHEDEPLYNVELRNPKLYNHLPELQELKMLRQQLCYLKSYLFTCSQKMADALRQKVWPREHLYDCQDAYSVTDLLQVQSNTLHKLVRELVKFAAGHVYECLLCSQKGFVCEICRNPKVIYPFEVDTTIRCKGCKAVYHKTCMTDSLPCPKCERWGRRHGSKGSSNMEDHPENYGMSQAS